MPILLLSREEHLVHLHLTPLMVALLLVPPLMVLQCLVEEPHHWRPTPIVLPQLPLHRLQCLQWELRHSLELLLLRLLLHHLLQDKLLSTLSQISQRRKSDQAERKDTQDPSKSRA